MVSEEADIIQSLNLLIGTLPGERIMRPLYGCDLYSQVFERINAETKSRIKYLIKNAIKRFEHRIILEDIEIKVTKEKEGIIFIVLHYTIIQTNSRSNMVYPFYIEEGTNIPAAIRNKDLNPS